MKKLIYALCIKLAISGAHASNGTPQAPFIRATHITLIREVQSDAGMRRASAWQESRPIAARPVPIQHEPRPEARTAAAPAPAPVAPDARKTALPANMYIRMGTGWTAGFISSKDIEHGYYVTTGLGWKLSSVLRAEIQYNQNRFYFVDTMTRGTSHAGAGMMYLDFVKSHRPNGTRRVIVPFAGIGAGAGHFAIDDKKHAKGGDGIFAAPRAELGFNVAITDFVGIDFAYRYEFYLADKFGWQGAHANNPSVSNLLASFRFTF
ncbi:MAG: hypothetical protein FWE17_01900 [Alphaproteobacteria bacterium]|nr:hypothetical protein [Alphaproteobacteria bacterium]MCL2758187.1 hypothetical protein [Alphaproteobacteria bacterium]